MRSFIIAVAILASSAVLALDWQELRSQHFIVYYLEDKPFARKVSSRAEKYYKKIASDLWYIRYDNFWQWGNRVKIYIYRTHKEFLSQMGIPRKWARGVAKYEEKEIASYRRHRDFLNGLLPHEIAHFVFRDFVGFPRSGEGVPLWLDEGVAQWAERNKKIRARKLVKNCLRQKKYIPLSRLTSLDIRQVDNRYLVRMFYAQSITIVDFLVRKYGGARFTQFARALRDGKSMNKALSSAYNGYISGTEELERRWIQYYKE